MQLWPYVIFPSLPDWRGQGDINYYSVDCIVTRLRTASFGVRIPAEAGVFFIISETPRASLGPIQPPILWVPEDLPGGKTAWVLSSHLHLAPRLRMCGAEPLIPFMPSWRKQGQLYLLAIQIKEYMYFLVPCYYLSWSACWINLILAVLCAVSTRRPGTRH